MLFVGLILNEDEPLRSNVNTKSNFGSSYYSNKSSLNQRIRTGLHVQGLMKLRESYNEPRDL